jgi:hypothetical protein
MYRRIGIWCAIAIAAALAVLAGFRGREAAATTRPAPWCEARTSASWRRVLSRHIVPLSRTTPLNPIAPADDGHSFFAEIYTPRFTGVAEIDAATSAVTEIKAFPDPTSAIGSEESDQAWGAFDGRWLVWNEYRGETSFDDFTTWAWDSQTRKLTRIGAATRAADGTFWPSPWHGPDVRDGIATWVQGVGPDQLGEVHAYDLRSGRDLVVRHGHPGGALVLAGHVLAWAESPTRGARTTMYAADALTGSPVRTPRALRYARGVSGLATDGRRVAYPSARYRSLWWSPSLRTKPQKIVGTQRLHYVDNSVQVGSRYIGFGIEPHVFVADTRTHRYVQVTARGGFTRIGAASLIVFYATGSKVDPIAHVALVPLRDLPRVPACS